MKSMGCVVIVASMVLGLAAPGVAQTQDDKPSTYKASPPQGLDPNYGLPAFALPGYEPPRPKAVMPEADGKAASDSYSPDFYSKLPESRFTLPRRTGRAGYSTTETPLYTTQEGMPLEDRMQTDTMEPDPTQSDTMGSYPRTTR